MPVCPVERKTGIFMSKSKYRMFFVQWSQYFDTHDSDGNPRNPDPNYFKTAEEAQNFDKWLTWRKEWLNYKIQQVLPKKHAKGQRKGIYIAICHDEDTRINAKTKQREPKPNHIHAYVHLNGAIELEKAYEFFEVSRKENCTPVKNTKSVFQYMLHITKDAINDQKHIYSEDELFSNYDNKQDMIDFFHKKIASKSVKDAKIDDERLTNLVGWYIRNGKLTMTSARHVFDKAYEENSTIYFNNAKSALETSFQSFINDKSRNFRLYGRDLTTILVTGSGGTGKSNLADYMAYYSNILHTWHDAPSAGKNKTVDIADGYNGEDTGLFNEFDGDAESFRAFCTIFDPHHYSAVSSRNKNKQMLITKAILTTSQTPLEFVTRAILQGKDDKNIADNLISSPEIHTVNRLLGLSSFNDLNMLFGEDAQKQNLLLNTVKDHGLQVARRLKYIIKVKAPNKYPYVPSMQKGLSIDTDKFLDEFDIVDAHNFDFTNAESTFFNREPFGDERKHKAILTSSEATTASTSYTLYKWNDDKRRFERGVTLFVADVTDSDVMRKLGLAVDMIFNIAVQDNAKNFEDEVLEKAMNN